MCLGYPLVGIQEKERGWEEVGEMPGLNLSRLGQAQKQEHSTVSTTEGRSVTGHDPAFPGLVFCTCPTFAYC